MSTPTTRRSYFVKSEIEVAEDGLYVNVDLEKTNKAINELIASLEQRGGVVIFVTPILSGVGQFQCAEVYAKTYGIMKKITKPPVVGGVGYGFGYSYTSGFLVLAELAGDKN